MDINKLFGFLVKKPPYTLVKGVIKINLENWEQYLIGNEEFDNKYKYFKCHRNGETWYHRENK